MNCIFCEIVARQRPAEIIYEDKNVLAFLDQLRQPSLASHTLIIPKRHVENVLGIDDELGKAIFSAQVKMAKAIRAALQVEAFSIWSSNGKVAGQEVPHFHQHIFPRYEGDGYESLYSEVKRRHQLGLQEPFVAKEILQASGEKIRTQMNDYETDNYSNQ